VVPAFYQDLGTRRAGSLVVLEAPWDPLWQLNHFWFYQRVHRQRAKLGLVVPWLRHPGLRFEHLVPLYDHRRLHDENVAYAVIHRNLRAEGRVGQVTPPATTERASAWIERYRRRYGPPSYEDDWIVVFDLRRDPLAAEGRRSEPFCMRPAGASEATKRSGADPGAGQSASC
jgi:hypothetical protein